MTALEPLARIGAAMSIASLALVVRNLGTIRAPRGTATGRGERIAVLLPVRDEAADVVGCLRAVLAAADRHDGIVDVLVLDDDSTDGTRELADAVATGDERVTVLTGVPAPAGWLGKPWACQQLADAVDPAVGALVFVDADVTLTESGLLATLDLLRSSGLDLVCPYPRQLALSPSERLVQPLLQWSWMSTLPLGLAETSPRPSLAAANGQLLAVDAAAYRRAGGHAAVRGEVLEDIALLRAVKVAGGRGTVAEGSRVASCRMYDGWAALRPGYTKSLWAAFGSPAGALVVGAVLGVAHVVPAAAALRGSRVGLLGYLASVASRALVARRTGGRTGDAWLHPVSVLALLGLTADSFRLRRRGALRWKGRAIQVPGTVR